MNNDLNCITTPIESEDPLVGRKKASIPDETGLRVMRLLEGRSDITQREISDELGISLGGINYCLSALVEKGWVKMENFSRSHSKLRYLYVLTPSGMKAKSNLTVRFLRRKLKEYEALDAEIAELRREISGG